MAMFVQVPVLDEGRGVFRMTVFETAARFRLTQIFQGDRMLSGCYADVDGRRFVVPVGSLLAANIIAWARWMVRPEIIEWRGVRAAFAPEIAAHGELGGSFAEPCLRSAGNGR